MKFWLGFLLYIIVLIIGGVMYGLLKEEIYSWVLSVPIMLAFFIGLVINKEK